MLDRFEIIKLLQSIIHRWKGLLIRYIIVSVVWNVCQLVFMLDHFKDTPRQRFQNTFFFYFDQNC